MFLRHGRWRGALLIALVGVLPLAAPAHAQFDIFHRQAQSPPANVPAAEPGEDQAAETVLRLNRLEEALRKANGRIEELENANRRLDEQLQKLRQDVEYRFGERTGAPQQAAPAPPPAATASTPSVAVIEGSQARPRKSDAFDPNAMPNAPGAPQPLGSTAPSAPLARANPPAGAPLDLGKAQVPPPPTGPTITKSGVDLVDGPRDAYNAALQAFQAGQFKEAEDGFKAFMAANPGHRLTPDAVFYIGESYFQRSRPREAAEQYLKVTTDFGKSSRAPESMVRLGQTLAALGNKEQACATFAEFGKRYPNATASVKRLADREIAKDHCS